MAEAHARGHRPPRPEAREPVPRAAAPTARPSSRCSTSASRRSTRRAERGGLTKHARRHGLAALHVARADDVGEGPSTRARTSGRSASSSTSCWTARRRSRATRCRSRRPILQRSRPALRSPAPDVPPGSTAVVDRCLEKDPAQRFAERGRAGEGAGPVRADGSARRSSGSRTCSARRAAGPGRRRREWATSRPGPTARRSCPRRRSREPRRCTGSSCRSCCPSSCSRWEACSYSGPPGRRRRSLRRPPPFPLPSPRRRWHRPRLYRPWSSPRHPRRARRPPHRPPRRPCRGGLESPTRARTLRRVRLPPWPRPRGRPLQPPRATSSPRSTPTGTSTSSRSAHERAPRREGARLDARAVRPRRVVRLESGPRDDAATCATLGERMNCRRFFLPLVVLLSCSPASVSAVDAGPSHNQACGDEAFAKCSRLQACSPVIVESATATRAPARPPSSRTV